jgi:hypothetical protein
MISPDLLGKRFVRLVVIKKTKHSRSGSVVWECLCDCGNTCFVTTRHLNRKMGVVKSCGCLKEENDSKRGKDSPYYLGHEGLSQKFFNDHILRLSKGYNGMSNKRNPVDINIDKEYLWNLFQKQNGKCKLSGLEITLPTYWNDKFYTASVDRIDSSKGYIDGNVQWVHKHINLMKNTFDNDYFIKMCKSIGQNN